MDEKNNVPHSLHLSEEVLRKIGRNVLLFQQIEGILKYLIASHRMDGAASDYVERQKMRANKVQNQMMGNLVKRYTDDILSDAGESSYEPEEITQVWISTSFTITGDNNFYESQRANMKLVVDERNDLIHHFLPRWQPDSVEHMAAAVSYLDQQQEKVMPMFEHLNSVSETMKYAFREMAEFLASDEATKQIELIILQQSSLVSLLQDVAGQKARPDGWAYLSHAAQIACIHASDSVTHMKERYGYSTLKKLLVASEIFDVLDEPLPNGSFRTLFREKKLLKQ